MKIVFFMISVAGLMEVQMLGWNTSFNAPKDQNVTHRYLTAAPNGRRRYGPGKAYASGKRRFP
jgi:hypothetical protein